MPAQINKDTEKDDNNQISAKGSQTVNAKTPQSQTSTSGDTLLKKKKDSKKPKVQIVGTSNIKYISPDYIGEKEFEVSKITKYTLDETQKFVEKFSNLAVSDAFIVVLQISSLTRKCGSNFFSWLILVA